MVSKNAQTGRRSERINSSNYVHVHLQPATEVSTAAVGGTWPHVSLSKQEIEEDFYNITGSRQLHRPKRKKSKQVKDAISMISPGGWLCGKAGKPYDVKEKRIKKRPSGIKAMDKAMERAMDDFVSEEDGDANLLEGLEEYMNYLVDVRIRAGIIK